jgi:hypothetical protein
LLIYCLQLVKKDTSSSKTAHSLRSSNFQFYVSIWTTAKSSRALTALSRKYYWDPSSSSRTNNINGQISQHGATKHRCFSAVADIVCQDGLEWVKVSSNTEKRIIWDLAKAGWVGDSDSEESEEESGDDGEKEGLLKQVEHLVKAARATRVRYRHPKVRLVLPRISSTHKAKEVGMVLQKIRNMGVIVQTSEDIVEEPEITDVLQTLVQDRFHTFSDLLNMDCTVLLAFASDLSHGRVEPQDWHNKMIQRQRLMEAEEQLLPSSLWPACAGRELVCTREAAVRMQEIVNTIGTITEKRRTELLLDLNPSNTLTSSERLSEFQALSDYTIPTTWCLPIQVVDIDIPAALKELPPIAKTLSGNLSDINASVILYGWYTANTTISSNRAVAKEIESTIEENRGEGDEEMVGPDVWLCSMTRSLVGKEKERRDGVKECGEKGDGN